MWLAVLVGAVVLAAAVAAVMASLSTQSTPDVVPYPSVTGILGEHLEELQKSVEP
jgi:serine protease inhibitor ecotin